MSSNTNSNNNSSSTSTPSITSDWTTVPNAWLNWDNNDMEEIAATKFQERCQHKKIWEVEEHKCQEEEELCKAEERCKAEEEARAHAAAEEKKKCEEAAAKDGVLEELQGQLNVLENLVKIQQNISWKMSQHYTILEDMLEELEVFATNLGELLEEGDMVDKEDLEEVRGELEGLGPIVNIEEKMEGDQQGENQDKGKGKERAE
ncbi:hypothetical protein ID866_10240 [Astraeus odoratus]|nr:hypothetical protein ID866_10240 [Astraeus odoratus]